MTLLDHVIELKESVASLHADIGALKINLLGNGQPGRIGVIESRVDKTEEAIFRVKKRISLWYGIFLGIALLGGVISGVHDLPALISFLHLP